MGFRNPYWTVLLGIAALCFSTAQAAPRIDLALCLDSSGSISTSDFQLQLEGTATAIEDPSVVPRDGSVRITVIQFGSSVAVEIPPTIIYSDSTAAAVAASVRSVSKGGGTTNMSGCIATAVSQILSVSPAADVRLIDLSTDGQPDSDSATAQAAANAQASGIDVLNALAVGSADIPFLESIVFPSDLGSSQGFVAYVDSFGAYAEVIHLKLDMEISHQLPILFVHGFCSDGFTWEPMIDLLQDLEPSRYWTPVCSGGPDDTECIQLYFDGNHVRRRDNGSTSLLQSQVYTLSFRNNAAALPFDPVAVNDVFIQNLAEQLQQIIEAIKAATGASQVFVVAHSMGGLVSRTFVESLGRDEGWNPISYDNSSVRRIVTLDTPHDGAELVWVTPLLPGQCVNESSTQKSQMTPGSLFLNELNSTPIPEQLSLIAVASGLIDDPFIPFDLLDSTDHVVYVHEQLITEIPLYSWCDPSTSNVGNIWTKSFEFINTIVDGVTLHNEILTFETIAEAVDSALYVEGLLFGDEFRVTCQDVLAWAPTTIGEIQVPGETDRITVTIDMDTFPPKDGSSCSATLSALQNGSLVSLQPFEPTGVRVVELRDIPEGAIELELVSECAGLVNSLEARSGPASADVFPNGFESGDTSGWSATVGGNLLNIPNPGFDHDLSDWSESVYPAGMGTTVWTDLDAGGSPYSGSAHLEITDPAGFEVALESTCLSIQGGQSYVYSHKHLRPSAVNDAKVGAKVYWYSDDSCSDFVPSPFFWNYTTGYWASLTYPVDAPAEARSVKVGPSIRGDVVEAYFDDIRFYRSP